MKDQCMHVMRQPSSHRPIEPSHSHPHSRLLPSLKVGHRNQLPHNLVLFQEPLLPALYSLNLIGRKILALVQRAIQIFCQHVLVEAPARQSPGGVPPRKVGVWPAGAVKVAAARDVEDAAAHGEVDGGVVFAGEGEEGSGCVGAEEGRGGVAREGGWRGGAEEGVEGVEDGGEEDDVEGGEDGRGAGES